MLIPEQQQAVLELKPLAFVIGRRRCPKGMELDDAIGVAYLALCEAAIAYSDSPCRRDTSFKTYAAEVINHELTKFIRKSLPVHIGHRTYDQLNKFRHGETGLSPEQLKKVEELSYNLDRLVYLDEPFPDSYPPVTVGETIGSGEDILEDLINRQTREEELKILKETMPKLPRSLRICISLRFCVPTDIEEIDFGEVLNAACFRGGSSGRILKRMMSIANIKNTRLGKGGKPDYAYRGSSQGYEFNERKRWAKDLWRSYSTNQGEENI